MPPQTKQFTVLGYYYLDGLANKSNALVERFKVNSPKQARQRFLKKYGSVLVGNWLIKINNSEGDTVLQFNCTNQAELPLINQSVKNNQRTARKKKTVKQGS